MESKAGKSVLHPSPASASSRFRELLSALGQLVLFLAVLYVFFVAIKLMGASSKAMGKGFAQQFLGDSGSSAILGLMVGVFATSLVQSSSTVTSMVVGFVAGGAFGLRTAIPIIMGANIGTTVTNTIVSLGHVHRRNEFQRAFAAGTVHDIFNILSVMVLFPLEQATHWLEKSAIWISGHLIGQSLGEFEGLKHIVSPVIDVLQRLVPNDGLALLVSLGLLFCSMLVLVRLMRRIMAQRVAHLIDGVLFRNTFTGLLVGTVITILVQSSSVTTSLIVPLVGSGILTLEQAFPYMLGANIGTTTTALLAALAFAATGSALDPTRAALGVTTAIVHTLFNVAGILIWYPMRIVPITLAKKIAEVASRSRRNIVLVILGYISLYVFPFLLYLLFR